MRSLPAAAVALLLFAFVAGCERIWSYDFFLHLAAGEWMLDHGSVLRRDFWLSDGPHPWTNVYWLFQVGLAALARAGGYEAISVAKGVALAAIAFGWIGVVSRRVASGPACLWLLLGLVILQTRTRERPEILTYLLLTLALWILESVRTGAGRSRLLLLVPVIALWANVHGLFPIGIFVIGAALVGEWIDARRGFGRGGGAGLRGRYPWIAALAAAAACLLNPWGAAIIPYALNLGGAAVAGSGSYRELVAEMGPVWAEAPRFETALSALLAAGAIAGMVRRRRAVPAFHAIVLGAILLLALAANRNIGLLATVAAPFAAGAFGRAPAPPAPRSPSRISRGRAPLGRIGGAAPVALPLILSVLYATGVAGRWLDRTPRPGFGLQSDIYPGAIVARIASDPREGAILPLNFGDAAAFIPAILREGDSPRRSLVVDGRLESETAVARWEEARGIVAGDSPAEAFMRRDWNIRFIVADFDDLELLANLANDPSVSLFGLDRNHACFTAASPGDPGEADDPFAPFAPFDRPLLRGRKSILDPEGEFVPTWRRMHPSDSHWRLGLALSILGRFDLGARYLEAAERLDSGPERERRGVLAMALSELSAAAPAGGLPIDPFAARALHLLQDPAVRDPGKWNGETFSILREHLLARVRARSPESERALAEGRTDEARAAAARQLDPAQRELRRALCDWIEGSLDDAESRLLRLRESDSAADACLRIFRAYRGER